MPRALTFLIQNSLFAVLLLLSICGIAVRADEVFHGPKLYLREVVLTSGDNERLLRQAASLMEADNSEAFELLLGVFQVPHDSLPAVGRSNRLSDRGTALQLLTEARASQQRNWVRLVDPLAAKALANCRTSSEFARVAWEYPYTPSAERALKIQAAIAATRGRKAEAFALQAEAAATQNFKLLPFASTANQFSVSAGHQAGTTPDKFFTPVLKPLWQWQEKVFGLPTAKASGSPLNLMERVKRVSNSWRAHLAGDTVLLRTPFRLIAFDKLNGRILWQLPTDSMAVPPQNNDGNLSPAYAGMYEGWLHNDRACLLTVSDRRTYFVDCFREPPLIPQQRNARNELRQFRELPLTNDYGSRLVAVTLDGSLAWVQGTATPDHHYQVLGSEQPDALDPAVADSPAAKTQTANKQTAQKKEADESTPSPFAGHRFMGPPAVYGEHLYVLTEQKAVTHLNCLQASNGSVCWRCPLIDGSVPDRFRSLRNIGLERTHSASLCGVSHGVVASVLSNGVVMGSRAIDGQLLWATNLQEDPLTPSVMSLRAGTFSTTFMATRRLTPRIFGKKLVCLTPQQMQLACLNCETGAIEWQIDRVLTEQPQLEFSADLYIADMNAERLILVGTRHVRAVSIEDGRQLWATLTPPGCGVAFCSESQCVLTTVDREFVAINLQDGTRHNPLPAAGRALPLGSLSADQDVVCVAGPGSLVTLPTGRRILDSEQLSMEQRTAALFAAEEFDQAVSALKNRPNDEARSILFAIAQDKHSPANPQAIAAISELADSGKLSAVDFLLAQSLEIDVAPQPLSPNERHQLLPIDARYSVRADIWASEHLSVKAAADTLSLSNTSQTMQNRIANSILYPDRLGSIAEQLKWVQQLQKANRVAAAELFLTACLQRAADNASTESQTLSLRTALRELRRPWAMPKPSASLPVTKLRLAEKGVQETWLLHPESPFHEALNRVQAVLKTPAWYANRLLVTNSEVLAQNRQTGVLTTSFSVPGEFGSLPGAPEEITPAILPFAIGRTAGVYSLLGDGGPQLLWKRRFSDDNSAAEPLVCNVFGPDFLILLSTTEILCVHPFDGRVLWQRNVLNDRATYPRLWNASMIGDRQALGRIGEAQQFAEVFRTRDGRRLHNLRVDLPRNTTPVAAGRFLLFPDRNAVETIDEEYPLRLVNLNSPDSISPTLNQQPLRSELGTVISGRRAIIVTNEMKLITIDLATGRLTEVLDLTDLCDRTDILGLAAFSYNGRVFVQLRGRPRPLSEVSTNSRIQDPRIRPGILLCLSDAGEFLWHREVLYDQVMTPVVGDPCPFMVTWTHKLAGPSFPGRIIERGGLPRREYGAQVDSMQIRLIDLSDGSDIANPGNLAPHEPLFATYNESTQALDIDCGQSKIKIQLEPRASASKQ